MQIEKERGKKERRKKKFIVMMERDWPFWFLGLSIAQTNALG